MAEEAKFYSRNIEVDHLITRAKQKSKLFKREAPMSRIIKAEQVVVDDEKICIIGGEGGLEEQDAAPAIVIEKKGDRISRIIVTCPCGRYSELVCEYDDEDEGNDVPTGEPAPGPAAAVEPPAQPEPPATEPGAEEQEMQGE